MLKGCNIIFGYDRGLLVLGVGFVPRFAFEAFLGAFGALLGLALLSAVGFICCGPKPRRGRASAWVGFVELWG